MWDFLDFFGTFMDNFIKMLDYRFDFAMMSMSIKQVVLSCIALFGAIVIIYFAIHGSQFK